MTTSTIPDLLALAEAVAAGDPTLMDAQTGLSRSDAVELGRLAVAVAAVRAHAGAVKGAAALQSPPDPWRERPPRAAGGPSTATAGPAKVAERVAAGPVRPGGARRGHAGSVGSRWMLVAATVAVTGALLAVTAIVGGLGSSARPAPTDHVVSIDATPNPAASSASPPVALSSSAAAVGPSVVGDLDTVRMMSATVGWGTTSRAILRTEDGGRTWAEVHAGPATFTRFVDESTAAFFGPFPFNTIVMTHDGGRTWRAATIHAPVGGPLQLTFRSADVGFATFWGGDPAHQGQLAVLRTDDGGVTWTGPVTGDEAGLPSYAGKAEAQGGDAGLIWATPGKADHQPFDNRFSLSADGGATWAVRPFPVDPLAPAAEQKAPASIRSDGAGHLLMVIGDVPAIFESHDDGRSWSRVRAWSQPVRIELRSMTAWTAIGLGGSFFDTTTDAGEAWRHIVASRPVSLVGVLGAGVVVTFGSPDVGLLLDLGRHEICHLESMQQSPNPDPSCAPGQALSVLRATSDGGRSWTQVAP